MPPVKKPQQILSLTNESTLDLQEVMASDPTKLQQYKSAVTAKFTELFGMDPGEDLMA